MIIGVCGFIGSGKDTIADYLVNFHEFRRESFASTLKDAVAAVFGWDRTLLEGRTKQAREWREQVDPWWAERLNMPNLTPRWVLQYWGTEVCRKGFHDDIWIASLENKLRLATDNVVISDCRFPNEIRAIKEAGGVVIRVQRGPEPEWYNVLVEMQGRATTGIKANYMKQFDIHASEWAWAGSTFDHVITNDGTIDELYTEIKGLVSNLPAST
jgi:hypothetical protein